MVATAAVLLGLAGCGGAGGEDPAYELGPTRDCLEAAGATVVADPLDGDFFPGARAGLEFDLQQATPTRGFVLFADDVEGARRAEEWARSDGAVERQSGQEDLKDDDVLRRVRNVLISFTAPNGLPKRHRELVLGCLTPA